jgi:hypothetical protein
LRKRAAFFAGYAACPACCTVNELEEIHISGEKKQPLFGRFYTTSDHFTKTGSGQT